MATLLQTAQAYDAAGGGEIKLRTAAAIAHYAAYILGGGSADANRVAFARGALENMAPWVEKVRWGLAGNAQFALDLGNITDANLQTAVEVSVNALVPTA